MYNGKGKNNCFVGRNGESMTRFLFCILLVLTIGLPAPAQGERDKSAADWIRLLASKNADDRQTAAYALGDMRVKDKEAVAALAACLDDPVARVRAEVADALGRIGYSAREAVPELVESIRTEKDDSARAAAVLALGYIGSNSQDAVSILADILRKDKSALVRSNAALALGRLGRAAKDAIPALVEALEDPHGDVQRNARNVLKRLDPDRVK
jgi:HEAT repeat protein